MRDTARACLITPDQKICLIKRSKKGEEYWVTPGGGIEQGETPLAAVIREINEEVGARVNEFSCKLAFIEQTESGKVYFFVCHELGARTEPEGEEYGIKNMENTYEPINVERKDLGKLNIKPDFIRNYLLNLPFEN